MSREVGPKEQAMRDRREAARVAAARVTAPGPRTVKRPVGKQVAKPVGRGERA